MTDLSKKHLPLPEQTRGTKKDIQDTKAFSTKEEAQVFYTKAKSRLLNVNNWGKICGNISGKFELTNEKGNRVDSNPQVGFYFKIDVPGPGAASGKGFDWVQVEAVNEKSDTAADTDYIIIKVRPASDPTTANENTAHFFDDNATGNFLVLREGAEVTAAVLGRNEVANINKDDSLLDKIRNFVVGFSAKFGMADPQWKNLVKGILQ